MPADPAATPHLKQTARGPLVLLFYDGFERPAREGIKGGLYSQARRYARYWYRTLRRKQVYTGFYTAFLGLHTALVRHGCDVRVNDFRTARRMPDYPVGIGGYPSVLDHVRLPNPAVFGPGDYGAPDTAGAVADRPEMRALIQPSPWFADFYRSSCGDKMAVWFAGIDLDRWPDARAEPKSIDVLIYDKIRWHRERQVPAVLDRLTAHLDARGLTYQILRYGAHHHAQFKAGCAAARSLAFLCEHETQGLAYQEAMAMGVPVFAWDEGVFVDPYLNRFVDGPLEISSVPYFDERCGMTFRTAELEPRFDAFWAKLPAYAPRDYVADRLSLEESAVAYLAIYDRLAAEGRAGR